MLDLRRLRRLLDLRRLRRLPDLLRLRRLPDLLRLRRLLDLLRLRRLLDLRLRRLLDLRAGPEEALASSADGCRGVENFHHQSRMTVQTTLRNCADSHEAVLTNVLCFRMIAYAQACKRLAFITGRLLPVLSPPVQSSAPRPVAGPSRAGRDVDQQSESADSAGPFVLMNPAEVASALEIGSSRFPSLYGCRPRSLQLDECQQRR